MTYTALGRAAAIALATLIMFGLVFLREATSPSGAGYWTAMAAAPDGNLYLADEAHRELRLVRPSGGWTRVAATPAGIYRALAASDSHLLLATEGKLYQSNDAGLHWRAVLNGRFTAVSIIGDHEVAGAWAQGLYYTDDAGAHWAKASVPAGDTEFETMAFGFAGTLLGLLISEDGDHTWTHMPGIPDRVTAIAPDTSGNGVMRVGDWRGRIWDLAVQTDASLQTRWMVSLGRTFPGGIESMAGAVIATTAGPYPVVKDSPLYGREVTRVVEADRGYFAAAAGGAVYYSAHGPDWTLVYQG